LKKSGGKPSQYRQSFSPYKGKGEETEDLSLKLTLFMTFDQSSLDSTTLIVVSKIKAKRNYEDRELNYL